MLKETPIQYCWAIKAAPNARLHIYKRQMETTGGLQVSVFGVLPTTVLNTVNSPHLGPKCPDYWDGLISRVNLYHNWQSGLNTGLGPDYIAEAPLIPVF